MKQSTNVKPQNIKRSLNHINYNMLVKLFVLKVNIYSVELSVKEEFKIKFKVAIDVFIFTHEREGGMRKKINVLERTCKSE